MSRMPQRASRGSSESTRPGHRDRLALERRGSSLVRLLVGGAVAVVAALYWLVRELGLDRAELIDFALTSLAFIGVFAVPGVIAGAVVAFFRRRRGG